jgi:hypothetical protein
LEKYHDSSWQLAGRLPYEETAARLMQESSKAKENGEAYARLTAENAAAAIARRHGQGR